MKKETLEKIRNILEHLFEIFIFILIMLITFGSLSVHAEESTGWGLSSNAGNYYHSGTYTDQWGNECSVEYYSVLPDSNYFYGFVRSDASVGEYDNVYLYSLVRYQLGSGQTPAIWDDMNKYDNYFFNRKSGLDDKAYSQQTFETYYFKNGSEYVSTFNCSSGSKLYIYSVQPEKYGKKYHEVNLSFSLPVFDSYDAMLKYCLAGDTSGLVNGGSIDNPDFQDTAYAFTGFTANNKMTATWTGTTERSYLKDEEVEEYVRVNYYFADKEAQDTIKQADAYPDEFATADKTLTIDVSGLKPDDENWFLRYIRITPCYRQAGLGAWGDFYHGSDVYVYFDVKGNIEKVIQKSKPTDLNKGNMVYDSSIGYLQNVIYTEQKTHDGSGRQATFKWSTLKSLPDDTQIEIVAQNFYIEWFNKKTEENFIYKEYGEDCFYSAGSYSFNANTPVWTWLKEKEIDPFSIKTQSYGSTEYYLRIVVYNDSDSLYHYGGWVKVDIKSKDTTIMPSTDVETGGFDDSSGLWNQDTASSDSYHYSTDDKGKLTGNIDVNSWEDLNMNSFTWMYRNMQSMVSSLGEFPAMVNAVFGYLPVQYITSIGVLLVAIVLLRFLGR